MYSLYSIGFWPESIEVIEKKPKQKYKDRKYHQQERFDPVYIKEIRQKVTSTFYGNTLLLILFIPWSLFAHNCYGNAINAINIGLKDFMTLFALNFWLSIYLGKPQTELWPSKPINVTQGSFKIQLKILLKLKNHISSGCFLNLVNSASWEFEVFKLGSVFWESTRLEPSANAT